MRFFIARSAAAAVFLAATLSAQSFMTSPVSTEGTFSGTSLPVVSMDGSAVSDLYASPESELRMSNFELLDGRTVDLELRRLDLNRMKFGFQVNGTPTPGLLESIEISVWTGTVAGENGSDVLLSFSNAGTRGWIDDGRDVVHIMPQPDAINGWDRSYAILARDEDLSQLGVEMRNTCEATQLPTNPSSAIRTPQPPLNGQGGQSENAFLGGCSNWEARLAIETDFQLFQVFGSLAAETSYITTLLAAASDRYETQINTVLSYPYVQFYTTSADPWSTPDNGGGSSSMLNEFESAWSGNIPADADIGHFVSGAGLGGGIAYLSVLCDTSHTFSFAVSGNIDGSVPFPVAVGPANWDFMVFTHETGHNFGSPHTHDYSPTIDECALGTCTTTGTIMSYCHQCPGGMTNITTFFHPTVVNVMQSHANSCLPFFAPLIEQDGPSIIAAGVTTPLTVELQGTPVSGVDLEYRFSPSDPYSSTPASDQGGGIWEADLPAASCGQTPEWFFSTVDASCGSFQTSLATADVGTQSLLAEDDLELSSGWSVGAASDTATTGVWELGNPNGTAAQPEDDHTPSGSDCWFTGQGSPGGGLGDNDVDGGATTLTSPTYDLSGSVEPVVSYWRWYNNNAGSSPNADVFVVDISNNGGASWTNVETVGPTGDGTGGGWILHSFSVTDFVTPTSDVVLRFIAEDAGSGSIVEAAVDDLSIYSVDCGNPWTNLGGGAPGINGTPSLAMTGPLTPGSSLSLDLTQAAPSALSFVWFTFASTPAPFLGGTLFAFPINIQILVFTSGSGTLSGSATFPGGVSGQQIWAQVGVSDASTVEGGSLSNATVGLIP
jgi:hypothetical protein